jgi:hypothetical protein
MALTYGTIWGDYGDEKVTSTTADFGVTIGTRMILPDGRVFRYAFSNGAAGAGTGVQSSAAEAQHDQGLTVTAAAAVGAKSLSVTLGSTAAAEDLYANGYLFVNDADGEGHVYRIRQHDAISSAGTGTFNLMDGDTISEAMTTSSKVGLVLNPYMHVIPTPAGAQTARCVGFAPAEVADNSYFWVQTWGEAAVLAKGTLVIFTPLRVSDDTTAGSVEAYSSDTDNEEQEIGFATNVLAATTEYQFAFLTISP